MSSMRLRTALSVLALVCLSCRRDSAHDVQDALQITIRRERVDMAIGDTTTLLAVVTVIPQETPTTVTWASDNASTASVDRNGLVTARSAGVAVITASIGTAIASSRVSVRK